MPVGFGWFVGVPFVCLFWVLWWGLLWVIWYFVALFCCVIVLSIMVIICDCCGYYGIVWVVVFAFWLGWVCCRVAFLCGLCCVIAGDCGAYWTPLDCLCGLVGVFCLLVWVSFVLRY